MSKKVDFDEVTRAGYRGRLINWEKWCDGEAHQLERGVDYQGQRTDSTRMASIQWAKRHGLKVKTAILSDDAFVFQVVDGLSSDQIALARRLQGLASDEAAEVLSQERRAEREAQRPVYDPVAERRERLSDQNPRDVLAESRPMARRRRV